MFPQQTQSPSIPNLTTGINGKWVDNPESITANDVSMQGVSVFPKSDLSEIVMKRWNSNGTIDTTRYLPQIEENKSGLNNSPSETETTSNKAIWGQIEDVKAMIDTLNEKVDKIIRPTRQKKEVNDES